MTQETLNKAIEINRKIEEYEAFLNAYNSEFSNVIRATDFKHNSLAENTKIIKLNYEPELEMMIREYVMHKIEFLKQQFAKLN